ncbi:MAG: acetyltransferase [Acidobacteriia bacterium]|nr:acetyltransferase [Terriglobia bacterium]
MERLAESPPAISFRPLGRSDFPLLQKWLAAPHLAVWWNECFDLASLEAKYGPGVDGREPIYVYLIQLQSVPIGWIQWYRWRDFPEHASRLGANTASAGEGFRRPLKPSRPGSARPLRFVSPLTA